MRNLVFSAFLLAAALFGQSPVVRQAGATRGAHLGSVSTDPTNAVNGDCWYNSTSNKNKCRENNANVEMIGGATGGGVGTYYWPAAVCQLGAAGTGFGLPVANAPTPLCILGDSTNDGVVTDADAWSFGVLSFAENGTEVTSQSIKHRLRLPSDWVDSYGVKLTVTYRATPITGAVVFRTRGQCVAAGQTPGNYSSPVSFSASTVAGTTLQWTSTSELTLTTSDVLATCAAGEWLFLELYRDATQAGDTLTGAAEVIELKAQVK